MTRKNKLQGAQADAVQRVPCLPRGALGVVRHVPRRIGEILADLDRNEVELLVQL